MSASQQILKMALGFVTSQALRVVADLGIADRLDKRDMTVAALAAESGADAQALHRVLRLLASEGVFREVSPGTFSQTELSAALRSVAGGPRDFVRMANREPYQAFARLPFSAETGRPSFAEVFGKPRFDWLADNPEDSDLFQRAMVAIGQGAHQALARAYDFSDRSLVVDVGGGHGQLLSSIVGLNPHLSGILFDRPAGIASARKGMGGPLPRCELVSGDFFHSVPEGGDVYIMQKVIHDWPDDDAVRILANCRTAMARGGRVLIAETVIPEGNDPAPVKTLDILMLAVTGGKERTAKEYEALLARAGLRMSRILPTSQPISIVESVADA